MDMSWITGNYEIWNVALQAVMALIWIAYLQIFLFSYLRQRRPVVLINRSMGSSKNSRCFLANMGAEPIHLTAMIADVRIDGEMLRTFVTDREELRKDTLTSPSEGTNQGPVSSGKFIDAGSYGEIVERALNHLGRPDDFPKVTELCVTVLCSSGYSSDIIAGRRGFSVGEIDGELHFVPTNPTTEQLGSRREKRRNVRILEKQLADERARLKT